MTRRQRRIVQAHYVLQPELCPGHRYRQDQLRQIKITGNLL
jgi:hypothetical protein